MQIVEATADARVLDAGGRRTYDLRAGGRYVLHDREAGFGLRDGAVRVVAGLERFLPFYAGQPLAEHRLILPFIGRQGDAIVAASCLTALRERYPQVTVDIAAPELAQLVLRLLPTLGKLLPYPLSAEGIDDYHYYLSFEEVEGIPDGAHRSCADVFSACLRTPRPAHPPRVSVPLDVRARWRFPAADRARVALHVGRRASLRSYPRDLLAELARRFGDCGWEVVLLGEADAADHFNAPASDRVLNLVGQTPEPGDLAAVLGNMQVLVTGDSLPLHLAGAMGVPTVALFTTTDAVIGSDYASVVAVRSGATCSPCGVAEGSCPLANAECIAHRDPALAPRSIVERAAALAATPS